LPRDVGGIAVPQDDVAAAAWRWAERSLPEYLLGHSVRSFAWGAAMARRERWSFDAQVLWTAALFHDVGLTHIGRNTMCFEIEGAEIARRFLVRQGMAFDAADRAAIAIILHMRPNVTHADGVEAVLLERATGLDVRGVGFELVADVRRAVTDAFPRGAFDRRFQAAIRREVEVRTDCQSARLFGDGTLGEQMAHSPWAAEEGG
jgi:hypothetical protein